MGSVNVTLRLEFEDDHIQDNFEWETPPSCCDGLKRAFTEGAAFVSNIVTDPYNHCYIMPVTANAVRLTM